METGVILQQMAVILILVLIGVFLQRKGIVNEDYCDFMGQKKR